LRDEHLSGFQKELSQEELLLGYSEPSRCQGVIDDGRNPVLGGHLQYDSQLGISCAAVQQLLADKVAPRQCRTWWLSAGIERANWQTSAVAGMS
jgi:hypothetical protein